jgi:thiamine pyrophosphate-dependent acetolactate synthase large subunit-like protein
MKMTAEEALVKVRQIHGIEHAFGIAGISRADMQAQRAV